MIVLHVVITVGQWPIIALSFSHSYSVINQGITSKGQKMIWRYEMSLSLVKLSLDNFLECALTEMTILTMYWKENQFYSRRLNCLEKSWLIAAEMWSSKMITVLMSSSLLLTLEIFNCSLGLNCKIMSEKQKWNMPYK